MRDKAKTNVVAQWGRRAMQDTGTVWGAVEDADTVWGAVVDAGTV